MLHFLLADLIATVVSWIVFYNFRKYILEQSTPEFATTIFFGAIPMVLYWWTVYAFWGAYTEIFKKSRIREFFKIFRATFAGIIILLFALLSYDIFVLFVLQEDTEVAFKNYHITITSYFFIQFVISAFIKIILISYIKKLIREGVISFRTLLVGADTNALDIYQEIDNYNKNLGFNIIGYVQLNTEKDLLHNHLSILGNYQQLEEIVKQHKIEKVIIAIESSEHKKIEDLLNQLEGLGVDIYILPDMYQILLGSVRVTHIFSTPLIEINRQLMPLWQQFIKRIFDVCFSLAVIILGFPFLLFFALMTKLSSKGPIIYSQERIGKGGKPFKMYKFRSMYIDAEKHGPALASDHDKRITPWGLFMRKTRIDELPQFFNVLLGDMSIVGYRPERQYFIDQIVQKAPHYKHLLRIKPGITSLGQVKFGYAKNVDEMIKRLKFDIIYMENMSLAMDFRILAYTVLIIFQGRGK